MARRVALPTNVERESNAICACATAACASAILDPIGVGLVILFLLLGDDDNCGEEDGCVGDVEREGL